MKRSFWIVTVCAALTASTTGLAQTGTKQPAYRVKNEVVVKGKVVSSKAIPDWMGKDGVNIVLESPDGTVPHVDIAPASFLQLFDFPIAVGDELSLTGCWSEAADGTPVFLVHELSKRRVSLNVRDPGGIPLW